MVVRWKRYVALGDAITLGWNDPIAGPAGPWLGWAGRLAAILDGNARLREERVGFVNLAERTGTVRRIVEHQLPLAIEARPDLVSVLIGAAQFADRSADPDALAARLVPGIQRLRQTGCDVLLATCADPRIAAEAGPTRVRVAVFASNLWSIARQHGTYTLDAWAIRPGPHGAVWSDDRRSLTPEGHRLLSIRAAHALGIPYAEVLAPRADPPRPTVVGRRH